MRILSRVLPVGLLLCAGMVAARADVKIVETVQIDSPSMAGFISQMPADRQAMMKNMGFGSPATVTVSSNGKMLRTDTGTASSVIVNVATGETTNINPTDKTYWVRTPDATPAAAATPAATAPTIKDTGESKTILGHNAEHYTVTDTRDTPRGTITTTGDIWAAADLTPAPSPANQGRGGFRFGLAAVQPDLGAVKGLPLQATLKVTNPRGDSTYTITVASVSQDPVDDSAFAIPTGFTKTDPPQFGGGGGGGR